MNIMACATGMMNKKRSLRQKPCVAADDLLRQHHLTDPYAKLKQQSLHNIFKRQLNKLEGQKKNNPAYFMYDESFQNQLVFLHVQQRKNKFSQYLPEVSQVTEEYVDQKLSPKTVSQGVNESPTLPSSSCASSGNLWNIFTLLNDWHILKARYQTTKADGVLKCLSEILDSKSISEYEMWKLQARQIYEAELAFLFCELGPKYYAEAVICYSRVMKWLFNKSKEHKHDEEYVLTCFTTEAEEMYTFWSNIEDTDCLKKKMIFWCFQFAQLLGKLLRKHNIHVLRSCYKNVSGGNTDMINTVYNSACNLLCFVTKTNDKQFAAWAWAVLAEVKQTYQLLGVQHIAGPIEKTPRECMLLAKDLSPEHPHVLLLVGRYLRERACSLDDFMMSVNCLEKVVCLCESMHVANHHLGLAYRSMWILDRHYPEAKLYNNCTRKAVSHSGRRSKNKKKRAVTGNETFLHPKYPTTYELLPKHYKAPDYFDKLRTSNPIEEKQVEHKYLKESYEHLRVANEKVLYTSARYLIDFARICISMRIDPWEHFANAANVIDEDDQSCSTDGAYLFEQWGLYAKSKDVFKAKEFFLRSLKFSVIGKQRSRVAFYELVDILDKIAESSDNCKAISKEKAFVFRLVEQYGKACEEIKTALHHSETKQLTDIIGLPENQTLLWELISCYYGEKDKDAAFEYLMIYLKCFPQEPEADKAKVALNIAIDVIPEKRCAEFQQVFRWIFLKECESDNENISECDVLLLTGLSPCPIVEKMVDGLETLCGLKVFQAPDDLTSLGLSNIYESTDELCRNLDCFRVCLADTDCFNKEFFEQVKREAHDMEMCFIPFAQDHHDQQDAVCLAEGASSMDIVQTVMRKLLD